MEEHWLQLFGLSKEECLNKYRAFSDIYLKCVWHPSSDGLYYRWGYSVFCKGRCASGSEWSKNWCKHRIKKDQVGMVRRLVHAERGEACNAWTEQVCEPHLNNTHTHTKNLNTLSPTTHAWYFEFRVLKVLENTQMFYLAELNFIDLFMNFCV